MTALISDSACAIVAVPDPGNAAAGALVYWGLSGNLDPLDLAVPWKEAGLEEEDLPKTPAPSTALRRAVHAVAGGRRRLVRSLEEAGAVAVVSETPQAEDLAYEIQMRAKLDEDLWPIVSPEDHPLAPALRRAYSNALGECSSTDVADWLVGLVRELDGVAMRDTGGFYYLPPRSTEAWKKIVSCVRRVSTHRLFTVPVMRSSDAIAAVLAGVTLEAESAAAALEEELAQHAAAPTLGERALQNRVHWARGVEEKVSRYEDLLGSKLEVLRARLADLQVKFATAVFAATPQAEEA